MSASGYLKWPVTYMGAAIDTRDVQVPRKLIGTDAFQETPIVEVTRQITKHNYLVLDINDLPRIIKEVGLALSLSCIVRIMFTNLSHLQVT